MAKDEFIKGVKPKNSAPEIVENMPLETRSESLPIEQENSIQMMPTDLVSGDLEASMIKAEKYLAIQDRLRKLAVNVTSVADWVNEGGKPYLQWTGTAKVAMAFGVSYEQMVYKQTKFKDDIGEYVVFDCNGYVTWQGRKIPEAGTGSSRDAFFGKRNGEYLPTSEVDLNNIKKKALTNFLNRGLKSMIGLSFSWEEIETITGGKITSAKVAGVSYDQGGAGGKTPESEETKAKKKKLGQMILEICQGNKEAASAYLYKLTTFKTKEGKEIKGKKQMRFVSEKQTDMLFSKVQEEHKTVAQDSKPPLEKKLPEVSVDTPTNTKI